MVLLGLIARRVVATLARRTKKRCGEDGETEIGGCEAVSASGTLRGDGEEGRKLDGAPGWSAAGGFASGARITSAPSPADDGAHGIGLDAENAGNLAGLRRGRLGIEREHRLAGVEVRTSHGDAASCTNGFGAPRKNPCSDGMLRLNRAKQLSP